MGKGQPRTVHYELNKINNTKKKWYFYWKNQFNNTVHKFVGLSEEDFINNYLDGDRKLFMHFEAWSTTESYQKLLKYYYGYMIDIDFVTMYKAVREKALQGDEKAIKTFLMLQNEMRKKNKNIADEDDGLEID